MRRAYVILALLVAAALAVASGEGGAAGAGTASAASAQGGHVSRRDVQATKRYVAAQYAFERAWRSSAPAAKAGLQALVRRVEGECPGVVAGALKEPEWAIVQEEASGLSARERGEANRWDRQRVELQVEVSVAVHGALLEPSREAALSFANATESLRWASATVTRYEHADASRLDWEAGARAVEVCADMRAWAQSGYTTLSSATNALIEEDRASIDAFGLDVLSGGRPSLGGFEDAHVRRLAGQAAQIQQRRGNLEIAANARLERALGLIDREEQLGHESLEHPAKGSVVLQRGSTAAGGRFTVRVLPKRLDWKAKRCAFGLQVEEPGSGRHGFNRSCLSRSHPEAPHLSCMQESIAIEAQLPGDVRSVRLMLIGGRRIASAVALVPRRLGGPAAFYYQRLRGDSPFPESIVELGRRGQVLRTLKLPGRAHCTRLILPRRIGGARKVPGGPRFAFGGFSDPSMRDRVVLEVEGEGFSGPGFFAPFADGGWFRVEPVNRKLRAKPFDVTVYLGCRPHEYAIVYGVLEEVRDRVIARSGGRFVRLQRVRIPASLHMHGALVYAVMPSVPSEMLVRSSAGRTVLMKRLTHGAQEARETCEGEAEPGGG